MQSAPQLSQQQRSNVLKLVFKCESEEVCWLSCLSAQREALCVPIDCGLGVIKQKSGEDSLSFAASAVCYNVTPPILQCLTLLSECWILCIAILNSRGLVSLSLFIAFSQTLCLSLLMFNPPVGTIERDKPVLQRDLFREERVHYGSQGRHFRIMRDKLNCIFR